MKSFTSVFGSLFKSHISSTRISKIYVTAVDEYLVQERDVAIASSRMHHTSLLISSMMQEEYKLKRLQFEIALDKIMTTYPESIGKENIGRISDEVNAKLTLLVPYPLKDDVFEKIREALLSLK